jgi:hypothetical protein
VRDVQVQHVRIGHAVFLLRPAPIAGAAALPRQRALDRSASVPPNCLLSGPLRPRTDPSVTRRCATSLNLSPRATTRHSPAAASPAAAQRA